MARTKRPLIRQALAYIEQHIDENPKVPDLARACKVSPSTLNRHFKQAMGTSPADYLRRRRIEHAEELLAAGVPVYHRRPSARILFQPTLRHLLPPIDQSPSQ